MFQFRVALVFFIMFVAGTKANALTVFTASLTAAQVTQPNVSTGINSVPFLNDTTTATTSDNLVNAPFQNLSDVGEPLFGVLSEPATVTLMGIGILVVGYVCRRRFRRR